MFAYLVHDLVVQAVAHIHRQQETLDVERRVEAALDLADGVQQLRKPFEGEVFALHGDEHCIGGREDIDGGVTQRRGAVDENVVEPFTHGVHDALHHMVGVLQFGQLGVGCYQVYRRGQQPQVLHVGALQDDLFGFPEPGDALVDAFEVYVEAQSGGGVGLRVGVEQQHLLAQQGQRCCEVDGRCGLAHAAFLIR